MRELNYQQQLMQYYTQMYKVLLYLMVLKYYSIVVANVEDPEAKGIYVINRGTDTKQNLLVSDINMALSDSPYIFQAGISFTEYVLANNPNVKHLGFSGHSLGGSITQAQVVYFDNVRIKRDKEYEVSISRNFEPFGIGKILEKLANQNIEELEEQKEMLKRPSIGMSPMQMDAMALNASNIARSTTTVNKALSSRYKGLPMSYNDKIVSYYRVGDAVAEQEVEKILGRVIVLNTNYSSLKSYATGVNNRRKEHPIDVYTIDPQAELTNQAFEGVSEIATDKFYNLHTMTNYRYQGYQKQNGSLFKDDINEANVKILAGSSDEVIKTRYNLVFNAMNDFEEL